MTVPTIAHAAADSASGGNRAVTIPGSGVAAGDVAFVVGDLQSSATSLTAPAGWTLVEDSTDGKTLQVWRRTLVSGDLGTSPTWTVSPGYYSAKLAIVIVSGADGTSPVNVLGSVASTGWGTSLTLTGPTTTVDDCLVLAFAGGADHGGSAAWSVTSGSYSEQVDTGGTYSSVLIASKSAATAGTVADCGLSFSSTWGGGILAGVLIGVAPSGTPGTIEGSASASLGSLTGSATGPGGPAAGRDTFLWPFDQYSIWNLPVGTGVTYESPGSLITERFRNVTATPWVNCGDHSHPFYKATYDDPYATIIDVDHGNAVHYAYIPAAAQIAPGTDKHLHVLQPDGETIIEMWLVTRNSSTSYTSYRVEYSDATGSGIGPDAGTRAYGGSAVGGLIRKWEVDPTDPDYTDGVIRHALALALPNNLLKYTGGSSGYTSSGYGTALGYVWPATEQDWDSPYAYTGVVPMGTFFIIPKTVNLSALGLSDAGYSVAKAMQDYGGYITDRAGGTIAWFAEPSVDGTDWLDELLNAPNWNAPDLATIRSLMVAVTNSTASTPAGGGTYSPLADAPTGATTIQGLAAASLGALTGTASGTVTGLTEAMTADLGTLQGAAVMVVIEGSADSALGALSGSAQGAAEPDPEPEVSTPGTVGWGGAVTLYVEIDLSQAVDAIGIAASYLPLWDIATWDEDQWGEGTTWTDVTQWVMGVDADRAFSRELVAYTAGRCQIVLDNTDGRFSPENPDSPYRLGDSTTIGVLRPIRVRASHNGVEWTLFTGRIEDWPETFYGTEGATVTVTAVDAFAELASFDGYEQTAAGEGEGFGDRINRILDNAGFIGERRIDEGEFTFQATTLAQNCVSELKLTADSEGGSVWVGGDGIFYADGQNALLEKDRSNQVQVLFSNADDDTAVGYEISSVQPIYDGSQVINIAAFARVGSTVRTYASADSRALYGERQSTRSDLICETDAQVDFLCERTVALYQKPELRVERLTFYPQLQPSTARQSLAWDAMARGLLALRSLVRLQHTTPAGFTLDKRLYVRGVHHTITKTTWKVDVDFVSASVQSQFYDSRWDLAVWDTAVWSW